MFTSAVAPDTAEPAEQIYRELMAWATGDGNEHVFACMIASWQTGGGSMPSWLGLSPAAFRCLMEHHFAGAGMDALTLRVAPLEPFMEAWGSTAQLVAAASRLWNENQGCR